MKDIIDKKINKALDSSNMESAIKSFSDQIENSFIIMENWSKNKRYSNIKNIMILGMGGSAIGGDVVRVIIHNNCTVPVVVNRSYTIPEWVNSETLIFACSYSGNTQETLRWHPRQPRDPKVVPKDCARTSKGHPGGAQGHPRDIQEVQKAYPEDNQICAIPFPF